MSYNSNKEMVSLLDDVEEGQATLGAPSQTRAVLIDESAGSTVRKYDSMLWVLRWFRISAHPCGLQCLLPSFCVDRQTRLSGVKTITLLADLMILFMWSMIAGLSIALNFKWMPPKPLIVVDFVLNVVTACPLVGFVISILTDLHSDRRRLEDLFKVFPTLFDKVQPKIRLFGILSTVLAVLVAIAFLGFNIHMVQQRDPDFIHAHLGIWILGRVALLIGASIISLATFSCLGYFFSLIYILRQAFGLLTSQVKDYSPEFSVAEVRDFMDRHAAILILIRRYSRWDKYLVSFAVTLITCFVTIIVSIGFFCFRTPHKLQFLLWPVPILISTLAVLGLLAWLGSASEGLIEDVMHALALKKVKGYVPGETDVAPNASVTPQDTKNSLLSQVLLFTYLQNSNAYWSIIANITPGLFMGLCTALIGAGSVLAPFVVAAFNDMN